MSVRRIFGVVVFALGCLSSIEAQQDSLPRLSPGSARIPAPGSNLPDNPCSPQSIRLALPVGTPLQVAVNQEIQIKRVGQPIQAFTTEPIYAFDHIVIPVRSRVMGRITRIGRISSSKRMMAALNAEFTPAREVEVNFDELALPDGKHIHLQTTVTPGSGQVIQFVAAAESKEKKSIKSMASRKTKEAKELARQEWNTAMGQLKTPGRLRRLQRYVEAQLPVHPHYIPTGTVYFVELKAPLDFGTEVMTTEMASSIGSPLPPGSVVHVRLVTALTSATSSKDEAVEAVVTQPLLDGDHHLIVPQSSRLRGTVSQVQPARHLKKNAQLRIRFQELMQTNGIQEKIEATLQGVESSKAANVKLDSEGGAEATTPKIRYLTTALSLTLAAASARTDTDVDHGVAQSGSGTGARIAGGANGFRLVGMVLGLTVKSRAFGYGMGAYGAGISLYSNFIARGQEVVFPKNTAMQIGIGQR
jgi:hypothetical protein